jgi:hypothetical protein
VEEHLIRWLAQTAQNEQVKHGKLVHSLEKRGVAGENRPRASIIEAREEYGQPTVFEWFEYLYNEMKREQ